MKLFIYATVYSEYKLTFSLYICCVIIKILFTYLILQVISLLRCFLTTVIVFVLNPFLDFLLADIL